MSTYKNCYSLMEDVRRGLNEYSTAYCDGTDTSGTYSNQQIEDAINRVQKFIYAILMKRIPGIFLTSKAITGVASVFALPTDFGVLHIFKDENNRKVYPIEIDKLKTSGSTGNKRLYYRKGNNLVLDRDGITDAYTLWYFKKCPDITQGKAAAEDTLASTAKAIADYYNNMVLENVSDAEVSTITDYTAARVVTITNTMDADDYYGIVSELPEMFHDLIAPRAIMNIKALSPVTQERPKQSEISFWFEELRETLKAYAGSEQDVTIEEIFMDLEPSSPLRLGIIASET